MGRNSAGILLYRKKNSKIEVFLVHPGGPFWAKKDEGTWSIPKGEFHIGEEDPSVAARREFEEETGFVVEGDLLPLGVLKQPSGKMIHAFSTAGDCDASKIKSNTFQMEWPPKSGKQAEFPEINRAEWFDLETARIKLHKGQAGFLELFLEKEKR